MLQKNRILAIKYGTLRRKRRDRVKTPHPSVKNMWQAYLEYLGETPQSTSKTYTAWHFCSTQPAADELAELVLKGEKRCTATSIWSLEAEEEPLPEVGDLSIITDWSGRAKCIIKTVVLENVPFNEVTEAFAAAEGEGDKSLEYWRKVHQEVFSQELSELGLKFTEQMPVLCETFEVVWPPQSGS
ncbi:MAG: ASCH domain-containing protein [Spirochaetota bacterium]